ncbi:MAG TPA: DUF72 domain-containing protein [Caulobacteraceae bacterium]|jgi:uncharacterized protein YecE (DUF72 family)|nr:DUF72 domain-containing protein [Caulobacteraceae bacterium]
MSGQVRVGTAGWQIPRAVRDAFPEAGSTLQRYAARFAGVEINSTFYRPHRPATFERWAADTPAAFRFAVKAPRTITHEKRLADASEPLAAFLDQIASLGPKLGPLLIQLPPSLAFDAAVAERFFAELRARFDGEVACEPRHRTWFEAAAEALLVGTKVARVAADPACVAEAAMPGGWTGFSYWRLHGSPRMYWSAYGAARITALAGAVAAPAWVVFDNTASGAATEDALALTQTMCGGDPTSSPAAASPASSPAP